ncbi:hypothetical protein LMG26411_05323 [Cupriavidus numazuensis]|uniref:LysR substrate-binding domain-containing protein n=1 Tax=Cupriavidus numazuensis TaxID=221992 RepID=A0ABN7Q4D8_9BURK|nr:hypothetical protein LMG26411_05323 [Cupriavidus numazuensis]
MRLAQCQYVPEYAFRLWAGRYDDNSSLGLLVRQTLARHALEPHSTLEVQTYSLALSLVEAGLGMALLDQFTALSASRARASLHAVQPALPFEIQLLRASSSRRPPQFSPPPCRTS